MLGSCLSLASHFTHGSVYTSILISQLVLLSPSPTLSTCSFSTSEFFSCLVNRLIATIFFCPGGSVVKNLPAMQETQVQFLGQKDPLEEEMASHSSILA